MSEARRRGGGASRWLPWLVLGVAVGAVIGVPWLLARVNEFRDSMSVNLSVEGPVSGEPNPVGGSDVASAMPRNADGSAVPVPASGLAGGVADVSGDAAPGAEVDGMGVAPVAAVSEEGPAVLEARVGTEGEPDVGGWQAREPEATWEAQIALIREGISPGFVDDNFGFHTLAALVAFQKGRGLTVSGRLDAASRALLRLETPPLKDYVLSDADFGRIAPVPSGWEAKAETDWLGYESIGEALSEKFQIHPNLLRRLNPAVDWTALRAGASVRVPDAVPRPVREKALALRIQLSRKSLWVLGPGESVLAYFPCSVGREARQRPEGTFRIANVARNPVYTFDPKNFPESPAARAVGRRLAIPAGPNNPVGLVWIGLDKPGYGIHGTPSPETVGRPESHGCFRLANWNALRLMSLVEVGMPVLVEP